MSGLPWFELDVDMPGDPKCRALAARLKDRQALAYVVRLYAYCYRHATASFPADSAAATIEDACEWRGKADVLFGALGDCGFLDTRPGEVEVHGVANRLAPHVAKLERDRERSRERRADVARTPRGLRSGVSGDSDKDKDRDRSTSGGTDQRAFPNLDRLAAALTLRWEVPKPVALPAKNRHELEQAVAVLGLDAAVELYHADALEAFKARRLDAPPSSLGFSAEKAIQAAQQRRGADA